MELHLVSIICIAIAAKSKAAVNTSDELLLKRDLFAVDRYDSTVRPVFNVNNTVDIYVSFTIVYIVSLDQKDGSFNQASWLTVRWKDEFLTWDPTQYGGLQEFVTSASNIWTPEIAILGRLDDVNAKVPFDTARVHYDGTVVTYKLGQLTTFCGIDPLYFPFDYQKCGFMITTWTYGGSALRLVGMHPIVNIHSDMQTTVNPTWDIMYVIHSTEGGLLNIGFCLKRKPLYLLVLYITPGTLHAILILVSFFVPNEDGEKISFGMSLFLSFVVLLLQLNGDLPEVSTSTPVLVKYFMLLIAGSVVSIISSSLEGTLDKKIRLFVEHNNKVIQFNSIATVDAYERTETTPRKTTTKWQDPRLWKKFLPRVFFFIAVSLVVTANLLLVVAKVTSTDCLEKGESEQS